MRLALLEKTRYKQKIKTYTLTNYLFKIMKRIFSFFAVMLLVLTLHAVPAYRGLITVNQPDGTTLKVYNHGDEFFHYKTTEDGYLVQENAKGVLEYAELSSDNMIKTIGVKARSVAERSNDEIKLVSGLQKNVISREYASLRRQTSAIKRDVMRRGAQAAIGNRYKKVLILLVSYNDVEMKAANVTSIKNMLSQTGYNQLGSAAEYFAEQSNGAYTPTFDARGPYKLSNNYAVYGANEFGSDVAPGQMVIDAAKMADAAGVDFSQYDNDNDGSVDVVYVIYAGKGEANGGDENTIWPHSWDLSSAGISYSNRKFDNVELVDYACNSELNGDGTLDGMGTFCHEFSHVLGLPDYYDIRENGTNPTPGKWSLMDYGSYNNNGVTPPNYSGYDKYYLGWVTPTIMNSAENVILPADGKIYRAVTSGTLGATSTSTIYYFENRQQTGWDQYLPGHGMIVWQVMYNSYSWGQNEPNGTSSAMRYDLIEADGLHSSYGDAGDSYPGSKNKTSYTPTGSYALTSIAENSGVISFKFMGGISQCTVTFNAGTNGTCATTSLTESASGAGVVLPTAVGKTNYTFVGWSTSSSALTADAGVAGATYHPTANCTLYAVYKNNTEANLTYTLEGVTKVTGANAGVITKNQAYTATFTAASCYETLTDASVAVEVLVGSTELTNVYTYNAGTLTISIPAASVTDNVSVTIYASQKPTVTFDLDNCTTTGAACISRGATYTATVTPNTDYLLSQNDFLITMNGVDLTASTNFTYVGTTLTIPNVTGNLVIVAIAVKDPSKVDCSNYSYTFTATPTAGALTLGAYNWNATITDASFLGYEAARGAQFGSGTKPAKSVSLTTTYTNDCCVSKVLVNAAMASGGDAKLAVYVDGTQVGTTSSLTTTSAPYTFTLTQPTKGNLEVRLTNTVKAMYIKSIAIEYGQCPTTDVENPSQSDVMVVSEFNGLRLVNVPSNAQIRIFDMVGRLMLTDNKADQYKVYSLSSGMYAIQITSEGKTYTLKGICN